MTEITNGNHGRRDVGDPTGQVGAMLYLRVASGSPLDASGIIYQREACMRIAARRGLNVIREYADIGKPSRYEQQTALRQLLDDLNDKRDASIVLVSDYTRLGRRITELTAVASRIEACGAVVVAAQDMEEKEEASNE